MHLLFEFFFSWFIASSYRHGEKLLTKIGFYGDRLVISRLIINYFIRHHGNCLIGHSKHVNSPIRDEARRECEDHRDEKFSPVQKWCRRWIGTRDVAVITLGLQNRIIEYTFCNMNEVWMKTYLCVRRLFLVVVHHVLFVVRATVFLQARLRQTILAVEVIIVLQISGMKKRSLASAQKRLIKSHEKCK